MEYPSGNDYVNAVQNCHVCVLDPLLKDGVPQKKATYGLSVFSGGYTRVFPVSVNQKKYALRCWTKSVENVEYRYQKIKQYLNNSALSCFVSFDYIAEGILVKGLKYPVLRMEWAEGPNLKTFIQDNLYASEKLEKAAHNFLQTVQLLHQHQIAHGDLQHENIIVQETSNDIHMVLIDYDSLYIPAFHHLKDEIAGKPSFQHPNRIKNEQHTYASDRIDYFSELVIYLTILAFAEQPSLWDQFDVNIAEDLIFTEKDFIAPDQSKIFHILNTLSPLIKSMADVLKNYCDQTDISGFLPLEIILQQSSEHTSGQPSPTINADTSIDHLITNIGHFSQNIPEKEKPAMPIVSEVNVDQLVQNVSKIRPAPKKEKNVPVKGIDQLIQNMKI